MFVQSNKTFTNSKRISTSINYGYQRGYLLLNLFKMILALSIFNHPRRYLSYKLLQQQPITNTGNTLAKTIPNTIQEIL